MSIEGGCNEDVNNMFLIVDEISWLRYLSFGGVLVQLSANYPTYFTKQGV